MVLNITQPIVITLMPGLTYVSTTGLQPTSVEVEGDDSTTLTFAAPGSVIADDSPIIVNATLYSAIPGTFKAATLNGAYSNVFGEAFTTNDCTSVTITPTPGAAITKTTSTLGPVNVGGTVTWTLSYSNPGSANLLTPYIEDILPSAFTFLSATPTPTYIIPGASGTRLRWTLTSPLRRRGVWEHHCAGNRTNRHQPTLYQYCPPFRNGRQWQYLRRFIGGDSECKYTSSHPHEERLPHRYGSRRLHTHIYALSQLTGSTLFSGVRLFDAPPLNTTYVSNSVRPSNLGIFGAYPRIAGVPGDDITPTTTLTLTGGASPFTYALGSTLTVTMALDNDNGNSGPITNVTAALTPSDGVLPASRSHRSQ